MTALDVVRTNLADLLALPDPDAAVALDTRMAALDHIHRIHERSYAERGIIAREFERRELWRFLTDPDTGVPFPHFTAWASCSDFLGCRRVTFEAKADMEMLKDVPPAKLLDVPKSNLKVLTQLSTQVRNQDDILAAAKSMQPSAFLEKVEAEHPNQHIESRKALRFSPPKSGAAVIEEWIAYALETDVAGSRDEAIVRACEIALEAREEEPDATAEN